MGCSGTAAERQWHDTNRSNRNAYTFMNPLVRNGSGTAPADLRYRGGNFLIAPRTDSEAAAEGTADKNAVVAWVFFPRKSKLALWALSFPRCRCVRTRQTCRAVPHVWIQAQE
ncbi:hypothetical protein ElyMa_000179700 [Elysia marginata]|uniref:Uncharacterized protein n=1 Tax=Elysia marginata TaxID=1093978 RepID=A0AAV4EV58_9GAST|nr:hypothetical protein ElyMa_000179700 [Elysia marginata]